MDSYVDLGCINDKFAITHKFYYKNLILKILKLRDDSKRCEHFDLK